MLGSKIQGYEGINGQIPLPEEVQNKALKHFQEKSKRNQSIR